MFAFKPITVLLAVIIRRLNVELFFLSLLDFQPPFSFFYCMTTPIINIFDYNDLNHFFYATIEPTAGFWCFLFLMVKRPFCPLNFPEKGCISADQSITRLEYIQPVIMTHSVSNTLASFKSPTVTDSDIITMK